MMRHLPGFAFLLTLASPTWAGESCPENAFHVSRTDVRAFDPHHSIGQRAMKVVDAGDRAVAERTTGRRIGMFCPPVPR